ncbi:hypothetical protein GOODEAATRI_025843 [Goodea atripinnis]|uniref:Secreted protein n=1 Tax=Goodea atripinnis TaxID=208336 RepID=A0ABV0MKS5_9TELE
MSLGARSRRWPMLGASWRVFIDLPTGLLLLGQLGVRCGVPSPLLFLSWDPRAWLLGRDRLGPRGTTVGPRLRIQFGILNLVGVSPGSLG